MLMAEEHLGEPASWQFNPESQQTSDPLNYAPQNSDWVSWTASEFILHQKNANWYLMLVLIAAAVTAVVFLLTRDLVSTITIAVAITAIGIFGARKPRTITYRIDTHGITIGRRFLGWGQFKSFAVVEEGPIDSIYIVPLKRFMPDINIYYAPEDEPRIINFLAQFLPHEDRELSVVDRLMHKIRF